MSYCFEVSIENFSSLYFENFQLTDSQIIYKKEIIKVIKTGFTAGIKIHVETCCEDVSSLRKKLQMLKKENHIELEERIYGKKNFLTVEEMKKSNFYSDKKAVEHVSKFYPNTKIDYTLMCYYCIGFWHGVLYAYNKINSMFTGEQNKLIKDTPIPEFIKEYDNFVARHKLGVRENG